ncbi:MAG: GNAT family N-acetyltransferase [Spirochaetota bacterium]
MQTYLHITPENIENEHICCAFSDKKCQQGYQAKKDWLQKELQDGYVFYRLQERAKVFIEYGPAETAWLPILAKNHLNINCFWVSGKYKGNGHGKQLLQHAITDAEKQRKDGLVTVVGKKKLSFLSDSKWLIKQGFAVVDETQTGFVLLEKKLKTSKSEVKFSPEAKKGTCSKTRGLVAYYSNRCPFTEFHINESLKATSQKRGLDLQIIKFKTYQQAQKSPSPATIFSLFYQGKFLTNDLSVCMENRFDAFWKKQGLG